MKIGELIEQLKLLPQDSNICIDGEDFHIAVKFYGYEEDIKRNAWSVENQISYFHKHRDQFPDKVRFRLEKNDEFYYKYRKKYLSSNSSEGKHDNL